MRHTDHCGLSHFRVSNHSAFDFGGTHAVAGNIEHVIDAAGDPVVTVFVTASTVAGEIHAFEGLEVGIDGNGHDHGTEYGPGLAKNR